ncbi:histamine H2 receptor [Eurytemora carolleeae]|uniref:histamine H2 receptor n=1 Tax=Eurytemora carolleeae TaxID=1294199 RepID=UPI000C780026|nr:histamine H2 receptor [Eurytemora carolleeae]|eukprot:XP_023325888.1 histamine H2 receptor-like [Eurytemora affinis]
MEEEGYIPEDEIEEEEEEFDEEGLRFRWKISTYSLSGLTILLNLIIVLILIFKRNLGSTLNKVIFLVSLADLGFGMCVIPFFVDNYVENNWNFTQEFCRFYTFYFTFHDLFQALSLIFVSIYISFKFTGMSVNTVGWTRTKLGMSLSIVVFSILLALPATLHAGIFQDPSSQQTFKQECRTLDIYTMPITYIFSSSILFCFSMGFLFSLCILGSPLLKGAYDPEEHSKKWRIILTLSVVNILYIICGFLLNFKEISRFLFKCCNIIKPFSELNDISYDAWSFSLLSSRTMLRPGVYLLFYQKYLLEKPYYY